ncbi:MAG: hypothetical protein ACXWL5_04215 [Candidatus Chromulinivorax sp.]
MKKSYNVFFLAICLIQSKNIFSVDQNEVQQSNNAFTEVILAEKEKNVHVALASIESFRKNPDHSAYRDAYIAQNPSSSLFLDKIKLFVLSYLAPKVYVATISSVRHFPEITKKVSLNEDYQITKEDIEKEDAYQLTSDKNDKRVIIGHGKTSFAENLIRKTIANFGPRKDFFCCTEKADLAKNDSLSTWKEEKSPYNSFNDASGASHYRNYILSLMSSGQNIQGLNYIKNPKIKMKSNYGFGSDIYSKNPTMPNPRKLENASKELASDNQQPKQTDFDKHMQKESPIILEFLKKKGIDPEKHFLTMLDENITKSPSLSEWHNRNIFDAINNNDDKKINYQNTIVKQYDASKARFKLSDINDDEQDYTKLFDRIAQ